MCPLDVPWIAARWADGGSGPLPLPVPESRLLNVEAHWIQALTPEWNRGKHFAKDCDESFNHGGSMKPKTTSPTRTAKPLLSLSAQVLFRNREGQIHDVTHQNLFGLNKIAEDGALALHILDQCRKRLDLLFIAAECRPQMDASLVRLAVNDLRIDMESGSHLDGYVRFTQELFVNSEAFAPPHASGARISSRSQSSSTSASGRMQIRDPEPVRR